MNKVLTDFAVKHAKPKAEGYEISDGGQRGLRLSVRPSGAKSWIVRYRHPISGISRKLTLSPGLTLAQARKLAADAMFQVAQGKDPIEAKRAEKQAKIAAVEGTLAAVVKTYMELAGSKLRSQDQYRRALARDILPKLGERQVTELRRGELVSLFDKIERERGPHTADMSLAVLRTVLHWYEKRSDTFRSPIIAGMARVKPSELTRDRVLGDDELKRVWNAAGDERIGIYGQITRFLTLTGARRSEAAGLRRSEIETIRDNGHDYTAWRLPAGRSKNKREIIRPLSRAALAIVEDIPIIGEDSEFVFTLKGTKPMAMNYPDKKRLLDEIAGVRDWRLHDLRRVYRSLLSRCRVPFEIAERLLGHSQSVLSRTYDQHSHLPAMLEATEKVAAEIERIVEGKTGKLMRFPGARA
jgi:integrase